MCMIHEVSMKSFNDWWKSIPEDLRSKSRKGDEENKPLLNQVNYVLLHLHLAGKHDAKPSHEKQEIEYSCGCKYLFNHETVLEHICSEHERELITLHG